MGLFQNDEDAYDGYTLFGNSVYTYLIDNCGELVNTWLTDYKSGHAIHLLENGNLLRAGQVDGDFIAGGRGGVIEIFNWEGQRLWQYFHADSSEWAHHDIALMPNGNFLFSAWKRYTVEEARAMGSMVEEELWSEKIIEMQVSENFEHKIIWQWNSWDHLIQEVDSTLGNYGIVAEHPEKIDINYDSKISDGSKNFQHINGLDYNAERDQIVFSSRFYSEIMVIDHSTTTEEARTGEGGRYGKGGDILYRYGNPETFGNGDSSDQKLQGQHSIQWLDNNRFIVFNNLFESGVKSRVQIFNDPAAEDGAYNLVNGTYGDDSITWSYTQDSNFFSNILSSAQVLPNDNILICLGKTGRFVEVTEDKKQVWDYVNPVDRNQGPLVQGQKPTLNLMFEVKRYPPSYGAFEGRDLEPQGVIELEPIASDCSLTSSNLEVQRKQSLQLLYDDYQQIFVDNFGDETKYQVFNSNGLLVKSGILLEGTYQVDMEGMSPGIYFLRTNLASFKFIKI